MRGLIKWILFAVLLVIAIILIVNFVKKTEKQQPTTAKPQVDIIQQNEPEDDTLPDESSLPSEEPMETDISVDSPNTASSGLPEILIGIVIIAFGTRYIYKNSKLVKENS